MQLERSGTSMLRTISLGTITLMAVLALAGMAMAQQKAASSMVSGTPATAAPAAASSNSGSSAATSSGGANDPSFHDRYPRYKLRPGDIFDVSFELSPEFNQTAVAVQPDGYITLRGVGDVHVAGQTVPELTSTLRTAYEKILHDPLISITLKDFEKPYFIADGQVGHPGKYDLRGDTTLTEAVAMAGGFLDSAKHSQVLLFRRVSDEWSSAQTFDIKKMHASKDLREDPLLHPGDMVFVPKNRISKIKPFLPTSSVATYASAY
jgi:polysaccharide biosynthesis/export protein